MLVIRLHMHHCKTLSSYLIYRQSIRVPSFDSGLIDIHNSDCDLGAHLCNHSARRTPYIAGPNATNLLYLKHLARRQGKNVSMRHTAKCAYLYFIQPME